MKKIIISSLVVIMILMVHQTWAQRSPSDKIDHLKTELNLTDSQVTQLEKIFEAKHDEMKALRSSEDKTKEAKREAMQNFRQSMEKEIEGVLDTEQFAKFQEIKKERRGEQGARGERMGHHKHFKDGKGKAAHSEIKAYKDANIKPVMLVQRAKLEPKISKADKELLAEIRVEFEQMKGERKARFEEKGKNGKSKERQDFKKGDKRGTHGINDEKREKMKSLVEKYRSDIEPLFTEVSTQKEKWEKDIHAIVDKSRDEESKAKREEHGRKHGFHGDRSKMMKMGHFLLLDPNEKTQAATTANKVQNITAFPNPATSATTIKYEVMEEGKILIELRDSKGNLLKTVKDTFHEKGTQQVTISLDTYKNDLFYVVIKDKNGVSSTKEIVRVR